MVGARFYYVECLPILQPPEMVDRLSFRNTLSAGDRSTLALAFFLAELAQGNAAKPSTRFADAQKHAPRSLFSHTTRAP
jgi:hypothetical protein